MRADSVHRNLNLELSKITQQIQVGHATELYCGTNDNESETPFQSPTIWSFISCGHGFNQSSCDKAIESRDSRNWRKLQCSEENTCGASLLITNPTERDSGLYRCSIYPFKPSLEIQVVKTYFLDVRNTIIPPPIIVDGPKNATTLVDSQLVLQCYVNTDSVHRNLNLELSKITQQIQVGHATELYCGTNDNESETPFQSPTIWSFISCGHGFNQSSCDKAIESRDSRNWRKLQCSEENTCGASLLITNPTERDSGLYRCSIYPFKPSLEIQVVKTYFLDVRNTIIPPPIIVDGPKNATTLVDSQLVLQCYVNSLIRPSITWFKRQDEPLNAMNATTNVIEYSDVYGVSHIYAQLESAGERLLTDGLYLSKLILNGVTENHSGFYVCVAINYGGFKLQEAYLMGLALAPLTLWICYVLFRKRGRKDMEQKIDTNGNDYIR
ncbi:Fibroblast growth factor receptor-like 1, partial [Pseudolycoriella hygida]